MIQGECVNVEVTELMGEGEGGSGRKEGGDLTLASVDLGERGHLSKPTVFITIIFLSPLHLPKILSPLESIFDFRIVYVIEWNSPYTHVSCTECPPNSEHIFLSEWFLDKQPPPRKEASPVQ